MTVGRRTRVAVTTVAAGVVGVMVLPALLRVVVPRPDLLESIPFSQQVVARDGTRMRLFLADDERYRVRVPLASIPPHVVEALLLQEDRFFRWHPGVNPVAMARAVLDAMAGGRRRGASTLTMQLARLRFGLHTRSVTGKLVQVARALQLELHHSKDDLLETYLALAPYGGNVEGVGAAALVHLGKRVEDLTVPESLALTVVPQHPARRGPAAGDGPGTPLGRARMRLFERWVKDHPGDVVFRDEVSLATRWKRAADLPFLAPHASVHLAQRFPDDRVVHASISLPHQRRVERALAAHLSATRETGLRNASVLVVDTRTMEVLAHAGSAAFGDDSILGQVDTTTARRSPGSALKPFIYALAVEDGLVHPRTLVHDAPARFAGYTPENFDGAFQGPLTVEQALTRSRNVPAVDLLNRVGPSRFHALLASAGIGGLRGVDHYGLGLALGGVEVTLRELVALYAMLSNHGVFRPLAWTVGAPRSEGTRLLQEAPARITLDMLKQTARPRGFAAPGMEVAFKTGTSHGLRDAWSVGLAGPYAIGAWQGNADGAGHPALVGITAAAPLLFRVVEALAELEPGAFSSTPGTAPPPALGTARVCAVSGAIPGPHCRHTVSTPFIPGVSPITPCTLHREIHLDARGQRACPGDAGARVEVMESWPSDMLELFAQAGLPRRVVPPLPARCSDGVAGATRGPRVTSPQGRTLYVARHAVEGRGEIPLVATTDADVRTLHWFADHEYLGRVPRAQPLMWRPLPGRHVLRVVDDLGRASVQDVDVAVVE